MLSLDDRLVWRLETLANPTVYCISMCISGHQHCCIRNFLNYWTFMWRLLASSSSSGVPGTPSVFFTRNTCCLNTKHDNDSIDMHSTFSILLPYKHNYVFALSMHLTQEQRFNEKLLKFVYREIMLALLSHQALFARPSQTWSHHLVFPCIYLGKLRMNCAISCPWHGSDGPPGHGHHGSCLYVSHCF